MTGAAPRYGYVRSFDQQEAKIQELLAVEAGIEARGEEIAEQLDEMMETWLNARGDQKQRDWVIRQWLKLFGPRTPEP